MMGITFATVVLIIRLAVPGEDLHDFYPGGGRDDNMIGFFNAHDCEVAARLVVVHTSAISTDCRPSYANISSGGKAGRGYGCATAEPARAVECSKAPITP